MSSQSRLKYLDAVHKSQILRNTANDKRLIPITFEQKQIYYHAALTSNVAAWDSYIKNLIEEFFTVTADPFLQKYHAIHTLAQELAEMDVKKLSTPNWDNARNFISHHTGYDPINDWVWPERKMPMLVVKKRLNEILKVRHSFAHGFEIPAYDWTQSSKGNVRLTNKTLIDNEKFINNLVKKTDEGLNVHIINVYSVSKSWY